VGGEGGGCRLFALALGLSLTLFNILSLSHSYLTQRIDRLVLESQLPHKTVNLIFPLVIVINKLTIFVEGVIF